MGRSHGAGQRGHDPRCRRPRRGLQPRRQAPLAPTPTTTSTFGTWKRARKSLPRSMHAGLVVGMALSPDGKQVLTVSHRATQDSSEVEARLWDAASGEPSENTLGTLAPYPAEFSPDGKRVLTVCVDRCARMWEPASGKQVGPSLEHPGAVCRASFSPDGRFVVTAGADGTGRVGRGRPAGNSPLHPPRPSHGSIVQSWRTPGPHGGRGPGGPRVGCGNRRTPGAVPARRGAADHLHVQPRRAARPQRHGGRRGARVGILLPGSRSFPPLKEGVAAQAEAFDPAGRQVLVSDGRVVGLWDLTASEPLDPISHRPRGCSVPMGRGWGR